MQEQITTRRLSANHSVLIDLAMVRQYRETFERRAASVAPADAPATLARLQTLIVPVLCLLDLEQPGTSAVIERELVKAFERRAVQA